MRTMKSVCTFFAFAFLAFAAKPPDKPEVQAQLLDRNEYACNNCFFGASTYYFCFEADNKILIGYEKIPAMNWKDSQSNWLTKVHKSWQPLSAQGDSIPLRYDEKDIWLTG